MNPHALASRPVLTGPTEVSKATAELKVSRAPGPNGMPIYALRHLPRKPITFLTKVFNAVLSGNIYHEKETCPRDFPAQVKTRRSHSLIDPTANLTQ